MTYFISQLTVHSRGKIFAREYVLTELRLARDGAVYACGSPLFGTAEYLAVDDFERLAHAKDVLATLIAKGGFEKCQEPLPGLERTKVFARHKYVGDEGSIEWPKPTFF